MKKLDEMEDAKPKKPKNYNQASNSSLIMLPHTKPQLPAFYNPMRKPEVTPTVSKQKTLMASNSNVSLFDKLSQEDEELCVQGAPPPVGKQYHLSYL